MRVHLHRQIPDESRSDDRRGRHFLRSCSTIDAPVLFPGQSPAILLDRIGGTCQRSFVRNSPPFAAGVPRQEPALNIVPQFLETHRESSRTSSTTSPGFDTDGFPDGLEASGSRRDDPRSSGCPTVVSPAPERRWGRFCFRNFAWNHLSPRSQSFVGDSFPAPSFNHPGAVVSRRVAGANEPVASGTRCHCRRKGRHEEGNDDQRSPTRGEPHRHSGRRDS